MLLLGVVVGSVVTFVGCFCVDYFTSSWPAKPRAGETSAADRFRCRIGVHAWHKQIVNDYAVYYAPRCSHCRKWAA